MQGNLLGETERRRQLISTANVAMQQPIEVSNLGNEMQKPSHPFCINMQEWVSLAVRQQERGLPFSIASDSMYLMEIAALQGWLSAR